MVIPILKYNNTIRLWEDNFFLSNWNLDEDKTKLVKYLIPTGDLEDQKNIDLNSFDINYYDSSYFLKKYGLKNSLILFINFGKDLDNIQYKLTLNKTNYYKAFSHTIRDLQLSKLINKNVEYTTIQSEIYHRIDLYDKIKISVDLAYCFCWCPVQLSKPIVLTSLFFLSSSSL